MSLYESFYRSFGIRKSSQFERPPLPPISLFRFPKRSIFHYVGENVLDSGPRSDDYLFQEASGYILLGFVLENGDTKGNPTLMPHPIENDMRTWILRNRRFRRMTNLEASIRDDMKLVGYNYALIPRRYRYVRSVYADYYRWYNTQAAVWKNMAEVTKVTDRHQFIRLTLPKVLPSVSDLKIAAEMFQEGGIGQVSMETLAEELMGADEGQTYDHEGLALEAITLRTLKLFPSAEAMTILEIWKWLGKKRSESLLASIPENKLDRINLVFEESGRFCVMNLGVINGWRAATDEELKANPNANKQGLDTMDLQRRFLRLMMGLFALRSVANPEIAEAVSQGIKAEVTQPVSPGTAIPAAKAEGSSPDAKGPGNKPAIPVFDPVTGAVNLKSILGEVDDYVKNLKEAEEGPTELGRDMKVDAKEQARIDKALSELETISKVVAQVRVENPNPAVAEQADTPETLESGIEALCNKLAPEGAMSAAEYKRHLENAQSYKKIRVPSGETLEEFVKIEPELLAINESTKMADIPTVTDKSMLKSSLLEFDERYIKKVLARDVASMVMNVQAGAIAVTGYEVERIDNVMGAYENLTVRVAPVEGANSTWHIKLPVMEADGSYTANGVRYRMQKQRRDLPIRKVAPDRVMLTSYYGKLIIERSEKRVNNYATWLCDKITALALDSENKTVTDIKTAPVFDNLFVAPRVYSSLAMRFKEITVNPASRPRMTGLGYPYVFNFDHTQREALYTKAILEKYEKNGMIVVGKDGAGNFLIMDEAGTIYTSYPNAPDDNLADLGPMEHLIGIDPATRVPVDFTAIKILGRQVPLGVVLSYFMGFENLMKELGVTPRRVQARGRLDLMPSEYAIAFEDETLIFSRDDREASLLLAGFNEYHRSIRGYSVYQFDKQDVYLNILESEGPSIRHLREIDHLFNLFIDPITKSLLVEMKEPTKFKGLLMRANELLLTDYHPDLLDAKYMRTVGYERIAGAVYSEIVKAIQQHGNRPGRGKHPIDLHPYAVWKNISTDGSKMQCSEINPIQDLKETEAVTTGGTGGRGHRSMTKNTRSYHRNEMGVTSESTVDSGDVAIRTYTSADPQFTSLRGIARPYVVGETGATALLSTSALLSVGSDRDDPKRVNFIGIQQGHGVACHAYTASAVRTGYEQVIAQRTSDMYAYAARKPGKVLSVTAEGMIVEYEDGEKKGIELGRRFGAASGLTIPHNVVPFVKEGQKFKQGDILSYNDGFFEPDILNPSNVVWKAGIIVKVALMESNMTLEDSSVISSEVAELLMTRTTQVRYIVVDFQQEVRRLVKAGQQVESEDILCIIEDAISANQNLLDDESLDTLRNLTSPAPLARVKGVIERIEVFYHGDKEDLSPSLKAIADASDRELSKRNRAAGRRGFTGSVDESFRIEGDPLALDTLAIKVYITTDVPAGPGDKGVFGNQLKTVFGEVLEEPVYTESNVKIGAIFGQKSVADRIVNSFDLIGTTTTLLDVIAQEMVRVYRS